MMRIVALNEESNEQPDEPVAVTREAQETIAEAEYVKAIHLKSKGQKDSSLSLLKELLETKVLNEFLPGEGNEKLSAIRYNCHKNIAIICEEKENFEEALENYIMAVQLDDTDVYTLHRFGQLALKSDINELAEFAFDKCLKCNCFHWNASDGLLQTYCRNNNVLGAYGIALKLYSRNPLHARAARVLHEISTTFKNCIPFCERLHGTLPSSLNVQTTRTETSLFRTSYKENVTIKLEPSKATQQLRIKQFDWISIGQYIKTLYDHFKKNGFEMLLLQNINSLLDNCESTTSDSNDVDQNDCEEDFPNKSNNNEDNGTMECEVETQTDVLNNNNTTETQLITQCTSDIDSQKRDMTACQDDAESLEKTNGVDTNKPKPRRRCSDLHFLEQWGWHKNKRYSSRKKVQSDRVEIDSSLNGVFRKMFSKYANISFDNDWPFDVTGEEQICENGPKDECITCKETSLFVDFQLETQSIFEQFIKKLKDTSFDLPLLLYEWLNYISTTWQQCWPNDIKILYLEISQIYLDNFETSTWNQTSGELLEIFYRINVLYLELKYSLISSENGNLSTTWKTVFDGLLFRLGYAYVTLGSSFNICKLRLVNLEFLWNSTQNNLEKSVACLEEMKEMITTDVDLPFLHLPNLSCITKANVHKTQSDFLRRIALNKIPRLFEENKWVELVQIVTKNISERSTEPSCENWVKNFKTQIEILLQSLWNLNAHEECMIWSEKCLHFVVSQYFKETFKLQQQELWIDVINFIYSYMEALILNEGSDISNCLKETLGRLIQNTIRLLSFQLDGGPERNINTTHELEMKRPFVILHQLMLRDENNSPLVIKAKSDEEDEEDLIPNSFSVLFTAHEFLGKRQMCSKDNGVFLQYILDMVVSNFRAPIYDSCRESIYECLEQVTFCLYGYPHKKARSRHLEDHEATNIELNWLKAMQVFDLYRPENLPEINSYKLDSITADMEQFFLKIISLMPSEYDPTPETNKIAEFIKGANINITETSNFIIPYKINCIFYLLGDYYFKNRDFSKAIKYYTLDLVVSPTRFDSWAGIALSKASKIETKLNGLTPLEANILLTECEDTIRCFEMCISLNRKQTLLWIEYGTFTYTIHSYCSRDLKDQSEHFSIELSSLLKLRKSRMLNIAQNCFSLAATLQHSEGDNAESDDSHEEKWLCQYMLGKISEKQKDDPKMYLNYYLKAANYLYDSNATYPIKINHSNPTSLSVEALEIFYRINSAIIKFLESKKELGRDTGNLFAKVLKSLANSPFAFNKAKIDGNSLNALKRKVAADKTEQTKMVKAGKKPCYDQSVPSLIQMDLVKSEEEIAKIKDANVEQSKMVINEQDVNTDKSAVKNNLSRRESEESGMTITTTTITSSTTSSSSSSGSSSSDSESDSEESSNDSKKHTRPYNASELENIFKIVIQNLEECVTRFPEHYKSIFRLAYYYMNAPSNLVNLEKCEQLLLGQYKTSLENQINGLFYDRKNNNIFNGIWRIPSSEIDRPGSFSSHLVKCAKMLIQLLMKNNNHKLLIDIGLQLYKTPEQDKRYIKDSDRIKLCQQSLSYCAEIMRQILKQNVADHNDLETLNLLIDVYKVHKKCLKYMNQKEPLFTQLLIDVYKFYISDKVEYIPENLNFLDSAIKLCLQEIAYRRNQEKMGMTDSGPTQALNNYTQQFNSKSRSIQIPGLTMRNRGRFNVNKPGDPMLFADNMLPMPPTTFCNDNLLPLNVLPDSIQKLPSYDFKNLMDWYKLILENKTKEQVASSAPTMCTGISFTSLPNPIYLSSSLPMETTITPAMPKSTQNIVSVSSTQTNVMQALANYDITITPTFSNPNTSLPVQLSCTSSGLSKKLPNVAEEFIKVTLPSETLTTNRDINIKTVELPLLDLPKFTTISSTSMPIPSITQSSLAYTMNNQLAIKTSTGQPQSGSTGESLLPTYSADYYNQFKLLSTYSELMKDTSLQLPIPPPPPQKTRSAPKRKPKQTNTNVNVSSNFVTSSNNFMKTSPVTQTTISTNEQQSTQRSSLPDITPIFYPSFELNSIIAQKISTALNQPVTSLPSSNASISNVPPSPNATFSPSQAAVSLPVFTPSSQSTVALPITPPKTLQQKLAERKKATQQTEINKSTNLDTSTDIIILD